MADDILTRENPFDEGSARFKLFARKQAAARTAVEVARVSSEVKEEPVEEEGFFSSFLGRAETIDAAVEGRKKRQSTDSNN